MTLARNNSVTMICRVLGLPRSSFYTFRSRQTRGPDAGDVELKLVLGELATRWPRYGYRRLTKEMQRKGIYVGYKRIRRLMAEMGLVGQIKVRKVCTTNSSHGYVRWPNLVVHLEIVRPDQVWVSDITYIRLGNQFVYLAVIMDVFTRSIRGWYLGRSLDQYLTLRALDRALERGTCAIHHSDQGVQYAASAYIERLDSADAKISMAAVGKAWENGYAERLMRTIKEEEVDLSSYETLAEAREEIGQFLTDVYQHKRIHSALGYLTPFEFETAYVNKHGDSANPSTLKQP